jgi:FkbM family methyltransferase
VTLEAISYPIAHETFQTPRGKHVLVTLRDDTNDFNTASSTLGTNDEYHLADLYVTGDVLDIGGYLGTVGMAIAVDNPEARVVIVEPVPENADLCEQNAAANGVADRVTVYRGAIGPKGITTSEIRFRYVGDSNLEHHAFVGNSSLTYPDAGTIQHEAMEVETLGLQALLDRFGMTEPEFVKIDCEGAEWPFFETATLASLRRLPLIVGEAHPVGDHVVEDMVARLSKTHDVTVDGWLFRAVRK